MAKADKALAARRVEDLLRIRLDGAEFWNVREYVREKEKEEGSAWFVAEDGTALSDSQIRRYQTQADALMMASHERSRNKLFRRHLAQRRSLYARAVLTGEIRTALACLRDERTPGGEGGGEIDRKQRLAQSVAFYEAVVCSNAPMPERMRAQGRIDRLLGLENLDSEERLRRLEEAQARDQGARRLAIREGPRFREEWAGRARP
jgi:hypothetical protein